MLKIKFEKYYRIIIILSLVFSVFLFIHYLLINKNTIIYDEIRYVNLSKYILDNGLFSINDPITTYFYPLCISVVSIFTNGNPVVLKIVFSCIQFLLYLFTIWLLAVKFTQNDNKIKRSIILLFGWINPYLINATTLYLTDISASCLIILSFLFLLSDSINNKKIITGIILGYLSIMVRPSSLLIIFIIMLLLLIRYYIFKDYNIKYFFIYLILATIIFLPQLYNNVISFNHWTPLIHDSLYKAQTMWAVQYLKYGTVSIVNENPSLFYYSPWNINTQDTIFSLILSNPILFIKLFTIHIFGVIDWGYISTYISGFYSPSRLLASLFLYANWLLILIGVIVFIKNITNIKKYVKFSYISLLIINICYMLFLGTTLVESRFGFPILMFSLPFIIIPNYISIFSKSRKTFYVRMLMLTTLYLVFNILMFYFSFLLDLQTNRINWFDKIFK